MPLGAMNGHRESKLRSGSTSEYGFYVKPLRRARDGLHALFHPAIGRFYAHPQVPDAPCS